MPLNYAFSRARAALIGRSLRQAGLTGPGANLPVLYMPGILGTKFYDRQERLNVWGDPSGLLFHKDSHAPFALEPFSGATTGKRKKSEPSRVIATEALHAFPIIPGLVHTLVTAEVTHVLEQALGYARNRDLFFIGHDWRQDYRLLGERLDQELARIDAVFGNTQKIVLMGQSSGSYAFCHWLAKAGEKVRNRIARWYHFGPPWQGSYHAITMMHEGYYPGTRRFHGFSARDISTYPSTYQLMPRTARLMDGQGRRMDGFDLTEPECWREYGLGPWHPGQDRQADSDSQKTKELKPYLDMARQFFAEMENALRAVKDIPHLYFLGDANLAVRSAVWDGRRLLLKAREIRKQTLRLIDAALAPGDDHLPLQDFADNPVGPFVRDPHNAPFGESFMFVSRAKDHRALINHTANLQLLAHDLAVVRCHVL